MKTINVVAAIVKYQNQILCVQRGPHKFDYISHKYEFPGGKVEKDETEEQALFREIQEELKIDINIGEKLITVDHTYPDFRIIMHSYICESKNFDVHLTEHIAHKWLKVEEMESLDWAAADIPIVDKLKQG